MRVLIIQENGHHNENRHMRECHCLCRAFNKHPDVEEVIVWGHLHPNFSEQPDFNSFDLILNMENYSWGWVPNLKNATRPKKFIWSIDTHVQGVGMHKTLYERDNYDFFLQATHIYLDRVPGSVWMPNAYDDSIFTVEETMRFSEKPHFMGFCGSQLNRTQIVKKLQEKTSFSADYWRLGQAMIDCIRSYKIHFNLNLGQDINYRNFETCGLGTVLLTNIDANLPGYIKMGFVSGKNCFFYDSKDKANLFDQVDMLSKVNDDFLETIGKAGNALVSKHHTYYNRVCDMIKLAKGVSVENVYNERNYLE